MKQLLVETPGLVFRTLDPDESEAIEAASRLDRAVWGPVGQDVSVFVARAINGYVIAALQRDEVVGTLSCLRRWYEPVLRAADVPGHPYATWDGITGRGLFDTAEEDGDALFCVAVTSGRATPKPLPDVPDGPHPALALARALASGRDAQEARLAVLAKRLARLCAPVHIPQDEVMRFHGRTKGGGLLGGARIVCVLPDGRPEDLPAMGYNVVMAYPDLPASFPRSICLTQEVSIGEGLVLAAAALASRLGLRVAAPYSRPAGFRRALVEALVTASWNPSSPDPLVQAVSAFICGPG